MIKVIKTLTLGAALTTGSIFGGGDIAPVIPIEIEQINPNPFYIGLGALWVDVGRDSTCCPDLQGNPRIETRLEDDGWGGIVRLGYDYNQYFGIEARALKAFTGGDTFDITHYGLFLKPMMPLGEQFNVYGLIGYGHTKVETTTCEALRDTYSENGMSYGIGLEYDLSDRDSDREEGEYDRAFDGHGDQEKGWGLWVDYQNLMNNEGPDNFKGNIVSFGVTYDF